MILNERKQFTKKAPRVLSIYKVYLQKELPQKTKTFCRKLFDFAFQYLLSLPPAISAVYCQHMDATL